MPVNRERKLVKKEVSTLSNLDYSSLKNLLDEVKTLIKDYGEDATIDHRRYEYSNDYYYAIVVLAPEDDRQYERRIQQEEENEKRQEARDAAEFKRLQEKFGSTKI